MYKGIMEKKKDTTIMQNQMEKKMENEMETGVIYGLYWGYRVWVELGFSGLGLLLGHGAIAL